jgi:serine/threonine protein kinase
MVVHHMNSSSIYHRDLKPENFLIKTEKNGKCYLHLTDFGFAKTTDPYYQRISSILGDVKGTMEYLAPEILEE